MRGRLPKPSGVRIMEGNPGRRPLPANEPKYSSGLPSPPEKISAPAKRVWDELVDEMACARVLRRVDQRALWQLAEDEALISEAYSGLWQMMEALSEEAKKQNKKLPAGPVFALLGMTQGRLAMAAIRDLASRVIIERREFGLTPSSRMRIDASADNSGMDALEAKLCG